MEGTGGSDETPRSGEVAKTGTNSDAGGTKGVELAAVTDDIEVIE